MLSKLRAFAAFWYDFIVGDDWRVAVGVVAAFAITYGVANSHDAAWWIVPVAVAVLLPMSVWRVARAR
jgi:hypothetical protein